MRDADERCVGDRRSTPVPTCPKTLFCDMSIRRSISSSADLSCDDTEEVMPWKRWEGEKRVCVRKDETVGRSLPQ